MANYGAVIQKLRKEKGYTQGDLGNMLNVSAQAVSKWEKNLSQPDLDTIQSLTTVFNISINEFMELSNEDELPSQILPKELPKEEPTEKVLQDEITVSDACQEDNISTNSNNSEQKTTENEKEKLSTPAQNENAILEATGKTNGWLLFGFIAGIILGISCMVYLIVIKFDVAISILSGYALFALIASIGHDCYGDDVLFWGWHKSIDIPGVIFSLDVDGIMFLIAYKIIIAPLLTLFLFLFFGLLGTIGALLVSAVTYPFFIPRMIRETFKGEE